MTSDKDLSHVRQDLAPSGTMRVGLNLANFLLVNMNKATGEPEGIAPSLARELATRLGLKIEFLPYGTPGEIAEDATSDIWDLALLAVEPARSEVIDFTAPYLEIESTYLVPEKSQLASIEDVDQDGIKIAVMNKSAYDLYLTRNIQHATLIRSPSMDESFDVFVAQQLDVLAGLKPRLLNEQQRLKGSRILPGRFTAVQQAIGVPKGKTNGANYIKDFVKEMLASGRVQEIIDFHGIKGVSVAQISS